MIAAVPAVPAARSRAVGDRGLSQGAPRRADRAALVDQLGVRSLAQLAPDGRCFGPAFEGSWPRRPGHDPDSRVVLDAAPLQSAIGSQISSATSRTRSGSDSAGSAGARTSPTQTQKVSLSR